MTHQVLFVCPHGAAKSVLAAAYFNQLASRNGLAYQARSAGTEPDDQVNPLVVDLLHGEGIDVSSQRPRRLTTGDLARAEYVITMGCDLSEVTSGAKVLDWSHIPAVSDNSAAAAQIIRQHVEALIDSLRVDPS